MNAVALSQVRIAVLASAVLSATIGAAAASPGLDEVVVTARGDEEVLHSVPLSLSAFTEQDMWDRGIETLEDLAAFTPSLDFVSTGNIGGTRPVIRGLSQQTRVGDEPNVATFIDGVYTPGFSGTTQLFDALARVEVVRGPQNAAYGRNSFAGAINYISNKPSAEFDAGVRSTLATDNKRSLSGFVSGPLVGSALTARIDAALRDTGGTYRNELDGEALANRRTDFARLGLRVHVGDIVFDGTVMHTKDDISPPARSIIDEFDPRVVGKPGGRGSPFERGFVDFAGQPAGTRIGRRVQGKIDDVADIFSFDPHSASERVNTLFALKFDWHIGERFSLVSNSGYQHREVDSLSDVDASADGTVYLDGRGGVIGEPVFVQGVTGSREDRDEISTDLRLEFDGYGRLDWMIGGYFSREEFADMRVRSGSPALQRQTGTCSEEIFGPGLSSCIVDYALPELLVASRTGYDNQYAAIYGRIELGLKDSLTLSLEARNTWEKKSADNSVADLPSNSVPRGNLGTRSFDYLTPRFNLAYRATESILLYAMASKGVKSGGFNGDAVRDEDIAYFPESNWTYELGGKFALWNGRGRFNVAGYYIDWKNQQVTVAQEGSTTPIVGNIAASTITGLEAEIVVAATDFLTFDIGYSFSDAKYEDAMLQSQSGWVDCTAIGTIECVPELDSDGDPIGELVSSGRADGNQLVNASRHHFNFGAEYRRPLGIRRWDVFVRGDVGYRSRRYVDPLNIGWVPSRSTVDLRLGMRNDRWTAEGFCENLFDDDTPAMAFSPRDFLGVPHHFVTNRTGRICGLTAGFAYR